MTAAILVLALGLVAACTPASDQPSAEQALCDALATFRTSVRAIADLSPTTASIEDLQAGVDSAQEAWGGVQDAAEALGEADTSALETAWTDLADQISNFSTDIPLREAIGEITAGVDEVQATYDEIRNGLGCEGS
ncbi:MAG TPA: hypothetical protein VGO32_06330 [Candidatus Limnocylindria bacterium]|jgi:hypothetical protein|nr:hypothetical protein [Candidatus Limnocylindria bacterium]